MTPYRARGFTLLEILVTLTLIVTILSMVYGSYVAAARATQGYSQRLGSLQLAHLSLRRCDTLIRSCYMPEDPVSRTPDQTQGAATSVRQASVTPWFQGNVPDGDGSSLSFVTQRRMNTGGAERSPLYRLHLQYHPFARTLSLVTLPYDHTEPPSVTTTRSREALLTDIRSCTFRFYDGRQWQTQWDSARAKSLPRAVEIELTVKTENQAAQLCRTVIPIPCFRPVSIPVSGEVSL